MKMKVTIYHNPDCGTSRNALATIRSAGHEPVIVEYLKTPLSRDQLSALITQTGLTVRNVMRRKEPLFVELGLDERDVGADELMDAMVTNPILLNRPIVAVERDGQTVVRLCRPSETVKTLLESGQAVES
jgi:arsenate reductase